MDVVIVDEVNTQVSHGQLSTLCDNIAISRTG